MQISSYRTKIYSVNSQLTKKNNFEIIFRNLELLFVKYCRSNFTYGAL